MLRLALWPMATKMSVRAANFQAAIAGRDQWIFKFIANILYWVNNRKFCSGQLPTISTGPKGLLDKKTLMSRPVALHHCMSPAPTIAHGRCMLVV